MKKNLIRFGGAAILAAGMAFAQASPGQSAAPQANPAPAKPGAAHRNFRQNMHQRMMAELNLTPAQREQAKTIFQQARQNAQPFAQQLRQNREALAAAVKANDNAKIAQLSEQRGRLEGRVLTVRSEAMAKFYGSLTPEQRTKADQMHQRLVRRMEQRRMEHTGQRTNG